MQVRMWMLRWLLRSMGHTGVIAYKATGAGECRDAQGRLLDRHGNLMEQETAQ